MPNIEQVEQLAQLCATSAKEVAAHLRQTVATNPQVVADYLEISLLRHTDFASRRKGLAGIRYLKTGEVEGWYTYNGLGLETKDPGLASAIATYEGNQLKRCQKLVTR